MVATPQDPRRPLDVVEGRAGATPGFGLKGPSFNLSPNSTKNCSVPEMVVCIDMSAKAYLKSSTLLIP